MESCRSLYTPPLLKIIPIGNSSIFGNRGSFQTTSTLLQTNPKGRRGMITATVLKSKTETDRSSVTTVRVSPSSLQYESGKLGAVPDHKVEEGDEESSVYGFMNNILSCKRVYDVAIKSPLLLAKKLSEELGISIWLKREDLQPHIHTEYYIYFSRSKTLIQRTRRLPARCCGNNTKRAFCRDDDNFKPNKILV